MPTARSTTLMATLGTVEQAQLRVPLGRAASDRTASLWMADAP